MHLSQALQNSFSHRRSGAVAVALALLLAAGGAAKAAESIKLAGTSAALATIDLLAERFTQSNPDIKITTVAELASDGGIKALSSGAIQLAVSSRPLDARETRLGLSQLEYARTPFVLAVSAKSAVSAITRQQLADIYSGRMVKWPDGSRIRVVLRPEGNRNNALLKRLSPGIARGISAAEQRPGMQFAITDHDAADNVEKMPGAIGAISLSVILSERRPLKALTLDGVDPTPANAATKAYPLYKSLFFVTGAKRSAATERFIAFVQSPAGRKILADHGHWIP